MTSEEEVKPTEEIIKLDENNEEVNQPSQEKEKENLDFKELYYSHPSQKDKVKKDFTEYSQVDMSLLNKKRERVIEVEEVKEKDDNNKIEENNDNIIPIVEESKNEEKIEDKNIENNDNNNKKYEEIKENDLENNLPKELLDLIEERKNKEPFTLEDFEKYKAYKKLSVSFSK